MDKFLVRGRAVGGGSEGASCNNSRCLQEKQRMVSDYELTGRMSKRLEKLCLLNAMKSYGLVSCFEAIELRDPWHQPVTRQPLLSDIAFSAENDLVACATSTGLVSIWNYKHIVYGKEDPSFNVHFKQRRLRAVRWDPLHPSQIGCVSGVDGSVIIFDIQNESFLSTKADSACRGLHDLQWRNWTVCACGNLGVYVWDTRASKCASMFEMPPYAGAIETMDMSFDDRVIFGGSSGGHVFAWDLRGGKASSSAFSSLRITNRPVTAISVSKAMSRIPHLQSQIGTGVMSIACLRLNPLGDRLALGLNERWTGVINLANLEKLTHIYCPPSRGEGTWATLSWLPNLPIVAVGSTDLNFLEFSAGSRHHVDASGENHDGCEPVMIEMAAPVSSIAAHPSDSTLLVGTGSKLTLISMI